MSSEATISSASPSQDHDSEKYGEQKVCYDWGTLRGCIRGEKCYFKHEGKQGDAMRKKIASMGKPIVCKAWSSDQGCHYGSDCPYTHEGPGKIYVEKTEDEMARERCRSWKSEHGCPRGDACPYRHEGESGVVISEREREQEKIRKRSAANSLHNSPSPNNQCNLLPLFVASSLPGLHEKLQMWQRKANKKIGQLQIQEETGWWYAFVTTE